MMGRRTTGQGQLFYAFALNEVVPSDHLVRKIDAVLDLSWVHAELAPFSAQTGRPSIDPELMLRMLIGGYVFAKRRSPTIPSFPVPAMSASGRAMLCVSSSKGSSGPASKRAWSAVMPFRSMPA